MAHADVSHAIDHGVLVEDAVGGHELFNQGRIRFYRVHIVPKVHPVHCSLRCHNSAASAGSRAALLGVLARHWS